MATKANGRERKKREQVKLLAPTGVALLIGAGLDFSPLESGGIAIACYVLAGAWLLWLYAEPRVVTALSRLVADELGLVDRQPSATEATPQLGELRTAVALISADLEQTRPILENVDHAYFDKSSGLPTWAYSTHGVTLARSGEMETHKAVRTAFQRIEDVNRSVEYTEDQFGDGYNIMDERCAIDAIPAIDAALDALNAVKLDP